MSKDTATITIHPKAFSYDDTEADIDFSDGELEVNTYGDDDGYHSIILNKEHTKQLYNSMKEYYE
jgi:hypothetical protein